MGGVVSHIMIIRATGNIYIKHFKFSSINYFINPPDNTFIKDAFVPLFRTTNRDGSATCQKDLCACQSKRDLILIMSHSQLNIVVAALKKNVQINYSEVFNLTWWTAQGLEKRCVHTMGDTHSPFQVFTLGWVNEQRGRHLAALVASRASVLCGM